MTGAQHVPMPYGVLPAPDVVDLLIQQHTQIRDLLADVRQSEGNERRDAFHKVVRLLSVHETAEEEVVHPAARGAQRDGEQAVADRLDEEHDAKELLERLDAMDVGDAGFLPLLQQLRTEVLTHAVSEQRYEFNRLRQHLTDTQRAGLRRLVRAAEAMAPTRPHSGVESATANLLLGPPVAIMDRARDAIRRPSRTTPIPGGAARAVLPAGFGSAGGLRGWSQVPARCSHEQGPPFGVLGCTDTATLRRSWTGWPPGDQHEHLATHVLPLDDGPRGNTMSKDNQDGCVRVVFRPQRIGQRGAWRMAQGPV